MNGLKLRSSQGCWTCRLRRKKCDEARPVCATCGGLEIDCHYSDVKPEWMDGGAREKKMADELKAMVRQKANERRERRWDALPTATDFSPSGQLQQQQQQQQQRQDPQSSEQDRVMSDAGDALPSEDGYGRSSSSTALSELSRSPAGSSSTSLSSPPTTTTTTSESQSSRTVRNREQPVRAPGDSFPENNSEVEVNFTMIYLDYVVPFLFPFYRPHLLEASRGWMLVLLMKNRALFHTALSLANWLYAVIFDSLNGQHKACRDANWAELQTHQDIAIKALQEDIKALNERGVANAFLETVSCIQSVIQLLEFEVAMADMSNWQVHHDVAVVIFDQLITHHAVKQPPDGDVTPTAPGRPWSSILHRIGLPFPRVMLDGERRILASDQTAFKFYTAYLLWIDVIAATALGAAPRLQKYHAELLQGDNPTINLGEYVGCESWCVMEIAEAAALAAWKREQQSQGALSMIELVRRACAIQTRLRSKMEGLPMVPNNDRAANIYDPSAYHPVTPYSGFHDMLDASATQKTLAVSLHTRIWAQATITYVNVLASGLQPSLPEIRSSVEATMELLRALPSPLSLRTVVWPFAVTGCLAPPGTEAFFSGLVADMGSMHVFGTVREALSVMENVWKHRDGGCCADPHMWDVATCFSVLGHLSLLV